MIKTNKKIIYLSLFLVLAVFLVSACNEAKGAKIQPGPSSIDYPFELLENVDLSSDSGVPGFSNEDTIYVKVSLKGYMELYKSDFSNLTKDKKTNEVWIAIKENRKYVFYKDLERQNKKTFAGEIIKFPTNIKLGEKKLVISEFYNPLTLKFMDYAFKNNQTQEEYYFAINFLYDEENFNSLGNLKSLAEPNEVQFCSYQSGGGGGSGGCVTLGTMNRDYPTEYGSTLLNPSQNGPNDKVKIRVSLIPQ